MLEFFLFTILCILIAFQAVERTSQPCILAWSSCFFWLIWENWSERDCSFSVTFWKPVSSERLQIWLLFWLWLLKLIRINTPSSNVWFIYRIVSSGNSYEICMNLWVFFLACSKWRSHSEIPGGIFVLLWAASCAAWQETRPCEVAPSLAELSQQFWRTSQLPSPTDRGPPPPENTEGRTEIPKMRPEY